MFCVVPKYVRAINFINTINSQVELNVIFKSGAEEHIVLTQNEERKVEREINQGSFTTVDPIVSVNASYANSERTLSFNPQGVEIPTYRIVEDGNEFNLVLSETA